MIYVGSKCRSRINHMRKKRLLRGTYTVCVLIMIGDKLMILIYSVAMLCATITFGL